mgnify:CR=1 FL=1
MPANVLNEYLFENLVGVVYNKPARWFKMGGLRVSQPKAYGGKGLCNHASALSTGCTFQFPLAISYAFLTVSCQTTVLLQ